MDSIMLFCLILKSFILTILCLTTQKISCLSDPCDGENHKNFPTYDFGSRNEKCDPKQSALCDFYFESDWYIIENATILNRCPSSYCGTTYPAWMQGTLPDKEDGVVNRTACLKFNTECCQENVTIQVKNCTSFYVFYLVQLRTCPMAYCFESNLPCIPPTTTVPPGSSITGQRTTTKSTTEGKQETTSNSIKPGAGNQLSVSSINSKAILIGVSVGAVGLLAGIGIAVLAYLYVKQRLLKKKVFDSTAVLTNPTYNQFHNAETVQYKTSKTEKI